MEKIYALLFILFILSQISERVANFLKLKLSDTELLLKAGDSRLKKILSFKNTALKSTDPKKEKEREYRILKINVFTGVFISFCFRTDIFMIINFIDDPTKHIGWTNVKGDFDLFYKAVGCGWASYILFILLLIVGCVITGFFISFGSKFWHDLLDLILQAKNYRGMLTRQGLDKIQNDFATLDYEEQEKIMDAAINENFDSWLNLYPNIIGASSGLKKISNKEIPKNSIIFKVEDKNPNPKLQASDHIPSEIIYKGYRIPTDVIAYEQPLAMIRYSGANEVPSSIGVNVSLSGFLNYGTTSLKVRKDNDDYLLSCFHVLCTFKLREVDSISQGLECHNQDPRPPFYISIPSAKFLEENQGMSTSLEGYFTDGILSNEVDAAIAKITNGALTNQTFYFDGKSIVVKGEFSYDNLTKGMKVETFGCVSGHQSGSIVDIKAQKTVVKIAGPGYLFKFTFNSLVELSCPCEAGDSGAPVLTSSGEVIGIAIAGNSKSTFVVPFSFIKNALKISI